jgi:Pyruvate/2-oxoacid:ferredoxin oxidoreductase delta subunit
MSGNVVVVGGGNTAIDCARTALRLGAQPLVLYRRTRKEMPAIEQEVEEAEREGIRFMFLAAPIAAQSGDAGLESIECVRMRLGPPDESGRCRPVRVDDDRFTLPADIVLTAIGETADLDFLPEDIEVRESVVPVDELGSTSHAPVFAGGDIIDQPRSVAHALGSGKRAAVGIDCYLRRGAGEAVGSTDLQALRFAGGNLAMARWHDADPVSRAAPVNRVVDFDELNLNHFRSVPRHLDRELVVTECVAGFAEANLGLASEAALAEAERCLNCGVCNECDLCLLFCPDIAITHGLNGDKYLIDMDYCKGCGICAAECPRGAMAMTRVGL